MEETKKKVDKYDLTVTDSETGEVLCKIMRTNCIAALANSEDNTGFTALSMHSCNSETLSNLVMGLEKLRKDVIKRNPMLKLMDKVGMLSLDTASFLNDAINALKKDYCDFETFLKDLQESEQEDSANDKD